MDTMIVVILFQPIEIRWWSPFCLSISLLSRLCLRFGFCFRWKIA